MAGALAAFIEDAYQDTLSLMTELRDYLTAFQASKGDDTDVQTRTRVIAEISAITRNLTEGMAWLLVQKAVAAGEITAEDAHARSEGMLERVDEATDHPPALDAKALPMEVRSYIDRSRRIYDQIHKLRDMTDRGMDRRAGRV
jgi:regulator of CtrA degradation